MLAKRIIAPDVPESGTMTFSNAWLIGNELTISGMTAHPATQVAAQQGKPLSTYDQALEVLRKIEALAKTAGGDKSNIIKTVVYITNMADKEAIAQARKAFFGTVFPCSTLVQVSGLVFPELTVEIDAWIRLDAQLS
jgi:2-iminobutanoate/2-iminopropanoate deaminase